MNIFLSAMRNLSRRLVVANSALSMMVIAAVVSPQNASAESYRWFPSNSSTPVSSPSSHCASSYTGLIEGGLWRNGTVQANGPERMDCYAEVASCASWDMPSCSTSTTTWTKVNTALYYTRSGDSCPADYEYNSVTGECVAPPSQCEATNGQTILHQHLIKAGVGQPSTEPPGSVCANSCQYTWGFTAPTNVYAYTSGNPPGIFGSYEYKSAGLECSGGEPTRTAPAGTSDTTNPDDTPTPDPDNSCPEGYVWNGTFCSKEPPKPCDPEVEVGGCDDSNPSDRQDPTDPTDPTDPGDGGGDGGGGDGDGDGSGDGDGDGDGDGSGDGGDGGETNCDPATDPDKCVKPGVTGEACDAEISCKGDAVQCAILKQQKQMRCNAEEQANFEKKKTDIEGLFQGEQFELKEAEVNAPSFINSAGRFLPSGCPSPESMNLRSSGGRTLQIKYEPLCQAATDMSWLIVAFTAMWCAVYVGRVFGGA